MGDCQIRLILNAYVALFQSSKRHLSKKSFLTRLGGQCDHQGEWVEASESFQPVHVTYLALVGKKILLRTASSQLMTTFEPKIYVAK